MIDLFRRLVARPVPGTGRSAPRRPNGFSLIELMMVAAIISLLAALSTPAMQRVMVKARATEAVSNLNVIKVAIQQYEGDNFSYPADVSRGQIPSGLADYLPEGFSFTFEGYVLDYDNYMNPDGSWDPGTLAIGLTVIPEDEEIGQAMMDLIGSKIWPRDGGKFTWVVID